MRLLKEASRVNEKIRRIRKELREVRKTEEAKHSASRGIMEEAQPHSD